MLVRDLFDLPSIDAQVPLGQQVLTKTLAHPLGDLLLMRVCKDHAIINGLVDRSGGLCKAEAIGVKTSLSRCLHHQGSHRIMDEEDCVDLPFIPPLESWNAALSAVAGDAF